MSFPAIAIGGHLSVSVGDRLVCGVWRRAPSGEHASKRLSDSRQQPFCNFVSKVVRGAGKSPEPTVEMGTKPRNSRVLPQTAKMPGLWMGGGVRRKAAGELADFRADWPSHIDSTRDSIDRDREFRSSATIKGAIPFPHPLAITDSHAPRDLIRSIRSRIWPTGALVPTLARKSRSFESSGTAICVDGDAIGRRWEPYMASYI